MVNQRDDPRRVRLQLNVSPFCLCNQSRRSAVAARERRPRLRRMAERSRKVGDWPGETFEHKSCWLALLGCRTQFRLACLMLAGCLPCCPFLLASCCLLACLLHICGTRHGRDRVAPLPVISGGGIPERRCFCIVLMLICCVSGLSDAMGRRCLCEPKSARPCSDGDDDDAVLILLLHI